ncbi:MAG TPA: MFS transporter, partial [Polyangiaceae bacterium]|nr:MFS transporter [Polyangiaceae bacterium]
MCPVCAERTPTTGAEPARPAEGGGREPGDGAGGGGDTAGGGVRARLVLALLTALNLLNYIDRYVLSAVLARIQDDLRLSNRVAGLLATVFLIGYFATSPIFGALGDRVAHGGRRLLLAFGVAVWSAATVASGLARGAVSLLLARA